MKIVVCDDEQIFARDIADCIDSFLRNEKKDFRIDLFYDCTDVFARNEHYDLAFLDVEMYPYNGLELAKKLKSINPHIIIFFITSHEKYLDDAMDINAFRFIKKPLDKQRLFAGLTKALGIIDDSNITIMVKESKSSICICAADIVYIEIIGRSTKLVTIRGEYFSNKSIDFWTEKLVFSCFSQVHKSFIINMNYITSYKRDFVKLCNQYSVPVSSRRQASFREFFFQYFSEQE